MDRFKLSKWEVVLGVLDRVNILCLLSCQLDVKMTNKLAWNQKDINTKPVKM